MRYEKVDCVANSQKHIERAKKLLDTLRAAYDNGEHIFTIIDDEHEYPSINALRTAVLNQCRLLRLEIKKRHSNEENLDEIMNYKVHQKQSKIFVVFNRMEAASEEERAEE